MSKNLQQLTLFQNKIAMVALRSRNQNLCRGNPKSIECDKSTRRYQNPARGTNVFVKASSREAVLLCKKKKKYWRAGGREGRFSSLNWKDTVQTPPQGAPWIKGGPLIPSSFFNLKTTHTGTHHNSRWGHKSQNLSPQRAMGAVLQHKQ